MTPEQKAIEAIRALINGEWDNEYLKEAGFLYPDFSDNIELILNYYVPCKK